MFKDDSQKIPTLIALCKLFLGDVKFEILLISRYFFMVFRMRYPPAHSLPRPFLWKWKVLRWYISHASFIYFWLVIPEFLYFKSFLSSWKYLCRLLLGGLKFWPVMQCKAMHQIFDRFYSILKKRSKLGQKTDFLAFFS